MGVDFTCQKDVFFIALCGPLFLSSILCDYYFG